MGKIPLDVNMLVNQRTVKDLNHVEVMKVSKSATTCVQRPEMSECSDYKSRLIGDGWCCE